MIPLVPPLYCHLTYVANSDMSLLWMLWLLTGLAGFLFSLSSLAEHNMLIFVLLAVLLVLGMIVAEVTSFLPAWDMGSILAVQLFLPLVKG